MLAQVGERQLPAAIQVKTKSERSKDFHLRSVRERSAEEANEWVVLVSLAMDGDHDYFVVPRDHAWATVEATLPENGRGLIGPQEFPSYRDAWHLLEYSARDAPWMVEQWVYDSWMELPWPEGQEPKRRH